MATKEELLRRQVNKIYPTGNSAPNLARTPKSTLIQLSDGPLTGSNMLNIARTPVASPSPPPLPSPTLVTGMGALGNQPGPPRMPSSVNAGMGALGNQPVAPPSAGPVDPLTNTPITPRVATPRPAVNSLTNQPIVTAPRSTLGPTPGTPAAIGTSSAPLGTLAKASRFLPAVNAGLIAADVANRVMASPEEGRTIQREDITNTLLSRGLSSGEAEIYSNESADFPKITKEKSLVSTPARPTSSFFETPATRANEAAGGGFRGMGAGLRASLDGLTKDYVNPAWKAGQKVRAGFMGETAPAENSFTMPLASEEAARWANWNGKNTVPLRAPEVPVTSPAGIAPAATYSENIRPATITATRPEGVATMRRFTGEAIPGQTAADRASPENPYGADIVSSAVPGAKQGGWVGARTDAEAARNLQDRALQDQATQAEVARLNRATDAMRSLREAQSPRFSFGASSIGGGPDTLDVASGRVINRDTPASVVASRMQDAVNTARRFGGFGGGKTGRLIAEEMGKVYLADKALQQSELEAGVKNNQAVAASNADMNKFLVGQQNFAQQQNMEKAKLNMEQQKFEQQQGLDKERLTVEKDALRNKQESTALGRQKYIDTQQKEFMNNYIAPEGAPADELKSGILAMSKATGLSPGIMNIYVQRVAKANNVDWKNAPPKDLKLLFEQATALAASENK